jgi:hypothetical protein
MVGALLFRSVHNYLGIGLERDQAGIVEDRTADVPRAKLSESVVLEIIPRTSACGTQWFSVVVSRFHIPLIEVLDSTDSILASIAAVAEAPLR